MLSYYVSTPLVANRERTVAFLIQVFLLLWERVQKPESSINIVPALQQCHLVRVRQMGQREPRNVIPSLIVRH